MVSGLSPAEGDGRANGNRVDSHRLDSIIHLESATFCPRRHPWCAPVRRLSTRLPLRDRAQEDEQAISLRLRTAWASVLIRHRTALGLWQEEAATRVGVDPSTLAKWERGEHQPAGAILSRVRRFLEDGREDTLESCRAG